MVYYRRINVCFQNFRMFGGLFLVCNYSPEGNVIGQPVFKTGPACTDCDLDRPACSRVFKGLCGNGKIDYRFL